MGVLVYVLCCDRVNGGALVAPAEKLSNPFDAVIRGDDICCAGEVCGAAPAYFMGGGPGMIRAFVPEPNERLAPIEADGGDVDVVNGAIVGEWISCCREN